MLLLLLLAALLLILLLVLLLLALRLILLLLLLLILLLILILGVAIGLVLIVLVVLLFQKLFDLFDDLLLHRNRFRFGLTTSDSFLYFSHQSPDFGQGIFSLNLFGLIGSKAAWSFRFGLGPPFADIFTIGRRASINGGLRVVRCRFGFGRKIKIVEQIAPQVVEQFFVQRRHSGPVILRFLGANGDRHHRDQQAGDDPTGGDKSIRHRSLPPDRRRQARSVRYRADSQDRRSLLRCS
ncbi:hypothetical protein C5Y96_05385 [Blastopirellula marina]|uniref:Uncharacterized protein n=1 Tax=Blastopirellula marina TaxID=124 RepID=A0A2S8G4B5_9BACT|nr:hypothetical protein C5Y96_05385 [Blastopirellula marina]RCS55596.1 hypothetical protein DTL36_05395 [Bremerella cremea]